METLFIADDEAHIREGLKYIIDWESLGFRICGEASNGGDALAQILALKPSLVLMDIRMPGMLGTEIIRQAKDAGFKGKSIILSGHSSFTYAQEAIEGGVSFYLTKPVDEDELYQAVSKIKELLSAEKQQSSHLAAYRTKAKHVTLHELVTNTLSPPLSEEDIRQYHLQANVYQIVICEDFHSQQAAPPYTFAELLKVINQDNNIFEHLTVNDKDIVLLKGSFGLHKLADFLDSFEERPLQKGSPMESMFLTYGRPVSSLEDVHLSYEDAAALLSRRFFCAPNQHAIGYDMLPEHNTGNPKYLSETDSEPASAISAQALSDLAGRFSGYIQSYNRRMTVETLAGLEDTLARVPDKISEIKLFLTDLYLQIKETINKNYASAEIPFTANSAVIEFIGSRNYLYEIIQFLSEQFEMFMNAIGNPSRNTVLDDMLYYIDHNFQNNIKLETIASLFGYNSAYLGKIFTQQVGRSFNSYVDHKRIEYSKQLLEDDNLKVYEIARQAGYKNVDYFHKKFKKYVGKSPAEYRKTKEKTDSP